jgi:hypothetical protein
MKFIDVKYSPFYEEFIITCASYKLLFEVWGKSLHLPYVRNRYIGGHQLTLSLNKLVQDSDIIELNSFIDNLVRKYKFQPAKIIDQNTKNYNPMLP